MNANHPLRQWRHQHKKTAEEFGRQIGVTKACVTRYERRQRSPDLRTLAKIMIATDGVITAKDFILMEAAQ